MLTDSQIVRLLDIANAGCHKGLIKEARTIYDGVLTLRPDHVPALIGRAISHIVLDDFSNAESQLRAVLADHPDDPDATGTLGLCLFLSGRKEEARDLLTPLVGSEGNAAALASALLEQM